MKHFAIVVDTLGQDRILTFNQRAYIFKIIKHMKHNLESSEKFCLDELVQLVTDQDTNMIKEFDSDYKNAKDKWVERLELPYNEEGRD